VDGAGLEDELHLESAAGDRCLPCWRVCVSLHGPIVCHERMSLAPIAAWRLGSMPHTRTLDGSAALYLWCQWVVFVCGVAASVYARISTRLLACSLACSLAPLPHSRLPARAPWAAAPVDCAHDGRPPCALCVCVASPLVDLWRSVLYFLFLCCCCGGRLAGTPPKPSFLPFWPLIGGCVWLLCGRFFFLCRRVGHTLRPVGAL